MTDSTRYLCPLDCGWHHDRPQPDLTDLVKARPDLTSFEIAQILVSGQLQYDEKVIREHLETHELLEWVQAVSRLTAERTRLAADLESRPLPTCDASCTIPGFRNPLGPCVLRHSHAGPVHKDATGATWWLTSIDAEAQLSYLRAKANEMLYCGDDKTITAGIRAETGRFLLGLLDEAQHAATAGPAATVTNHTYEGTPGAGNPCQAEAFGETCNAPWEQHAMRPES